MLKLTRMALACLLLSAGIAPAQEPDSYVLLVGIAQYADREAPTLSELPFVRRDLDRMHELVGCLDGFAHPRVVELWQEHAVKAEVMRELDRIAEDLTQHPGNSALVYFSGHGLELPDIEPYDEEDGWDEAFALYDLALQRRPPSREEAERGLLMDDDLAAYFRSLPQCRRFVFVADACHSGGLPKGSEAGEEDLKHVGWLDKAQLGERGLVTSRSELLTTPHEGLLVILASQDGESALTSRVHEGSMLTYALYRALVEDAATCDRSGDGEISLAELEFYLEREVDRLVQAEYSQKGQQVQVVSAEGQSFEDQSRMVLAHSSDQAAGEDVPIGVSAWSPESISGVAQALAGELAVLSDDLPVATATERFDQPLRSGDAVGWTIELEEPASIAVVSFAGKGNSIILDPSVCGPGDWTMAGPGTVFLPGGEKPSTWDIRFEARGLEYAVVLLLPPGTSLGDYPALRDMVLVGYRAVMARSANDEGSGAPSEVDVGSFPGLLVLPYEVEP